MELEAEKSFYARDMAERVGLAKWIDYRVGDALQFKRPLGKIYLFKV